jgi:hypothetical protein
MGKVHHKFTVDHCTVSYTREREEAFSHNKAPNMLSLEPLKKHYEKTSKPVNF